MLLFTTLELGPTPQKGTPFWFYFGDLFSQKNEKRGFLKRPQNQFPKTIKMGPKLGGGFEEIGLFLGSETCSDPLCCYNAPEPPFFTILASLFLHFCVAARYQEQLFLPSPSPNWGEVRLHFFISLPPKLGGVKLHFWALFGSLGNTLCWVFPPPQTGG